MSRKTITTTGTMLVSAALAFPGGAAAYGSGEIDHVARADAAIDQVVSLVAKHRDAQAERSFRRSRTELAAAVAEAKKLNRHADTAAERGEVASMLTEIAKHRDENTERLTGVLGEADGRFESLIAKSVAEDSGARDKAIDTIAALIERGVPAKATSYLTRSLGGLVDGRSEELRRQAEALCDENVSPAVKEMIGGLTGRSIEGQKLAAARLATLASDGDLPAEAKAGLERAYGAVSTEQAGVEKLFEGFVGKMPESIRARVGGMIDQARANGEAMRGGWPGGAPSGTPGAPSGTPGAPSGTPAPPAAPAAGGR